MQQKPDPRRRAAKAPATAGKPGRAKAAPRAGKAKRRKGHMGLALAVCAVAALLMYLSGGVGRYGGTRGAEDEIAANRRLLAELQAREPVDLNAELKRQRRELLAQKNGILVDDMEAEQQKILAMTEADWDRGELARWFEGTAIVGDSIINQVRSYHWLDSPVFSKGGIHISIELDLLDDIEAAQPSVIFLCFGMNDVGVFLERVDRYVERYSNVIRRLQANVPDAVIYVHATLPVTDECVAKESKYQYIDLYNQEMKKVCPELGCYFIDSGFILKARPELYARDGRHPRENYYPLWLTYLADCAGLNQ